MDAAKPTAREVSTALRRHRDPKNALLPRLLDDHAAIARRMLRYATARLPATVRTRCLQRPAS